MLEIKGDSDHTKLIDMLTDLNDYSIGIEDVLKEHFDEENIDDIDNDIEDSIEEGDDF